MIALSAVIDAVPVVGMIARTLAGTFSGASAGWILLSTVAAVAGIGLVIGEMLAPRSPGLMGALNGRRLERSLHALGEHAFDEQHDRSRSEFGCASEVGGLSRHLGRAGLLPADADLRVLAIDRDAAALQMAGAMAVGFALPLVLVGAWSARSLTAASTSALGLALALVAAVIGGLLGAVTVRRRLLSAASAARIDLRHQLSAYLDLVTMLVSGQAGHESALEQATGFGDGRLFRELGSACRRSVASGGSMVDGLRSVGERLGLDELDQVAASIELADSDGAPVARSLGAKCATLRSTLASEHELEARLRTSRLTAPIVGMSLVFMVLVIYPAMAVT